MTLTLSQDRTNDIEQMASVNNDKMDNNELNTCNGDTEYDIWVDFDYYQNTGEPAVVYDQDVDDFIENLNDWD